MKKYTPAILFLIMMISFGYQLKAHVEEYALAWISFSNFFKKMMGLFL